MKTIATLSFGVGAFLFAYATGALAEDHKDVEALDPSPSVSATGPAWDDGNSQGFRMIVDEADAKTPRQPPAPRAVPEAREAEDVRTVRMVVEAPHADHDENSNLCVFVPAGNDAGGALSCPGGEVRVFEFGGDHGRQFLVGDEVIDGEEIRALVEARIAEVNERLADSGAWNIEVIRGFDNEEFQREMEVLNREMTRLQQTLRFQFQGNEGMSAEDRAEYEEAMAEFQAEMAEVQAEAMAEVAAAMAEFHAEGVPVAPRAPRSEMSWFGGSPRTGHIDRQVIRVERDGERHVTIIEQSNDDDGNPRIVIRTTDPASVEVVRIDPDELDAD